MNRDGHNNVKFFVGSEVEHTPAYAKKTLFVVGIQDAAEIERMAREQKTPHIFLGANHSFEGEFESTKQHEKLIHALLDRGFWVTLEYPAHKHDVMLKVLNAGIWQCRNFVPLLRVQIPKIENSSINLTVKIDDIDFNATNPGVWCMHYRELTDSNRFTGWIDYEADSIIGNEEAENISDTSTSTPPADVTKTTDVIKPVENIEDSPVEESLNNTELGLDINPTTSLKPDAEEDDAYTKQLKGTPIVNTPDEAAALYAADATTDSLGKDAPKKTKVTKKAEA